VFRTTLLIFKIRLSLVVHTKSRGEETESTNPVIYRSKNDKRRNYNMNSVETIYLSKKGMKELKKSVARLERDRQDALTSLRDIDRADGRDERLIRIEKLAVIDVIESELADKKMALDNAKLFPRKRDAFKVAIGSVVDLLDTQGRIIRYTLVDSIEANPSDGRISVKSPLGKSLIGKQIQDAIEWTAGVGTNQLKLVGIG
jgi:transcription elongation factor GreA